MKNKIIICLFAASAVSVIAIGCSKTKNEATPNVSGFELKQDVNVDYNQASRPAQFSELKHINNDMAAIGRMLFYDSRLSFNGTISCASCHKQQLGFADNVAHSRGINLKTTTLNSMAINNPGFDFGFFWKNRANSLTQLALMPVANHIEMGILDIKEVEKIVGRIPLYQQYFDKAFGSNAITQENIANCIAEFVTSIQGLDSKYDLQAEQAGYMDLAKTPFPQFSALENQGKQLFFEKYKCNSCHGNNSQIEHGWSNSVANIGLNADDTDPTFGPFFKAPSLRNIALTAPYMHDGRFATLEEVLEHYSSGIKANPNLSWELQDFVTTGGKTETTPKRFNISAQEKKALIAFLGTLTNHKLLTDKRFSNPFAN